MSNFSVNNVRIAGVSACVPTNIEENIDLDIFSSREEAEKTILSTGIARRRVCNPGTTASDLAERAVVRLLDDLGWEANDLDCLYYVSTSRDYIAPQTSCILQSKLRMREDSFVIDLPLGCSGWVYGLSVAAAMIQTGHFRKGILVCAETNTKNRSPKDRSVRPLFGDAATVTALEFDSNWSVPMNFVFGVDGAGWEAVHMKYGGMRHPVTHEALQEVEVEKGIVRKGTDMVVNGMDVFSFAIRRPSESLKSLISTYNINIDSIDYLLLHQANKFINEKIRRSLKFPVDKVPYCLNDFGNVTNASIGLVIVNSLADKIRSTRCHCLACGFGVGLAWASCEFTIGECVCSPLLEVNL